MMDDCSWPQKKKSSQFLFFVCVCARVCMFEGMCVYTSSQIQDLTAKRGFIIY